MPTSENSNIKRHYPDQPLAGVAAVIFKGEAVLLVRRGQVAGQGGLEPSRRPGGGGRNPERRSHPGDRRRDRAHGTPPGHRRGVGTHLPDDAGRIAYHYVLIDYLCEYLSGEPKTRLGHYRRPVRLRRFTGPAPLRPVPLSTLQVIQRARDQRRQGTFLPLLEGVI